MAGTRISRSVVGFYVVVAYVFASYIWWAFLLNEKNMQAYQYHIEAARLEYNLRNGEEIDSRIFNQTDEYRNISDQYKRQRIMIFSEGGVFLLLLALGAYSVRRYLTKEMALALQQRNFMLSITHELRSPLASIKLSLQTFFRRVTLEDKFQKLLTNSLADIDRLEALVDNILLAAKVEDATYQYALKTVDLSVMVEDVLLSSTSGRGEQWNWDLDIEPDLKASVDEIPFVSVLLNLIENAMKYSPKGSTIQVTMKGEGNKINLSVADEGAGIPDDEKAKIFEKFYRIGNEETRSTKGTGLGLYIVRRVVVNLGGTITVKDRKPHGAIFTILLPKAG